MSLFALSMIAVVAAADNFIRFRIKVDGDFSPKWLTNKNWSSAFTEDFKKSVTIANNNSLFLRNSKSLSEEAMYEPMLRGGSIEYDVDVSAQDCGCVAGVYLVRQDAGSCGEVD